MKHIIIIAIVLSTLVFGCKKKESAPEPTPSTTGTPVAVDVNSAPQATFMLDGVNKSYVANGTTLFDGSGSSGSGSGYNSYSSDINDGNTISYVVISKSVLNYSASGLMSPTDSAFKAFFPITSSPYTNTALPFNGVDITIYDNGTYWSASQGTANQTGSTFNIVQTKDNPDLAGTLYIKIKATFSCKVYDGNGNSKTITNGVFIGNFGNI